MKIKVLKIIQSDLAINFSDGLAVYNIIKGYSPSQITISFDGIKRISTAFLNEAIGKYTLDHKENIQHLTFEYPNDKVLFRYKVNEVIENALLGEDYDNLVDIASLAL